MANVNKRFGGSKFKDKPYSMLQFVANEYQISKEFTAKRFMRHWFDSAKDFYQKDLRGHYGCVNAIEFSSDGELLFSGGDDKRVLLWNLENAIVKGNEDLKNSVEMKGRHNSNIFCLAIDSENKRLLSGGNDQQVLIHDYVTRNTVDTFLHESQIFSISQNPQNGFVFVIAGGDGQVLLLDSRNSLRDPICVAQLPEPFLGVTYHPLESSIIATANAKLGIHLWDVRKPKQSVQTCCTNQGMAVRWNKIGSRLLCIRSQMPPMLLDPTRPTNRLEFDAKSYYNASTMKNCCFAGDSDEYIICGSDDFNLYVWKIPEPWPESNWVPFEHLILRGHRSIVNQVSFSASKQIIASSGIEKIVKIWSPSRMPNCLGNRDEARIEQGRYICSAVPCRLRSRFLRSNHPTSMEEDHPMLHFFDVLVRRELLKRTTLSEDESSLPSNFMTRYNNLIRRKKKHLIKTMTYPSPNICLLPDAFSWSYGQDSYASSRDGVTSEDSDRAPITDSDSSDSYTDHLPAPVIRTESSSVEIELPSEEQLSNSEESSAESSDEEPLTVVQRRGNRCFRCHGTKRRPP